MDLSLIRFDQNRMKLYKWWLHAARATFGQSVIIMMTLGAILLGIPLAVQATTNISGAVTDSITGKPVADAGVKLYAGETLLKEGATDSHGFFQLFVNLPVSPASQMLDLKVTHPGYSAHARNVKVSSGQAVELSYKVSLQRKEAIGCVPESERSVVIGHIREPASATHDLALSQRVRDVLEYDLLTEIQKTHLPSAQQPTVLACPNAQPRTLKEHSDWAQTLKADAFVVGAAEPVDTRFKVDMQVTARYGDSASLPALVSTPEINLNLPSSADLGRAALEPIMIALLKAYLEEGRYADCVEFSTATEHAVGTSTVLSELRKSCQDKLRNRGLLTGGGQ